MELMAVCVLHADFHVMGQDCWGATVDWFMAHEEMPDAERRDTYQAEVERAMLDALRAEVSQ